MLTKNRGRNIINIEEIKKSISLYAQEKKLSVPIELWLQKTFLRWVINHFPYFQIVHTAERYKVLLKVNAPSWFDEHSSSIEYLYIDMEHQYFQEILTKCSEFLGTRDKKVEHKFPRMTVEQVLKKWQDEHDKMLNRSKVYKETSKEALQSVFKYDDLELVKFLHDHKELPLEMARESALMQHCLGEFDNDETGEGGYGEYYIDLIRKQEIELYSLRDEKNMPHVTVALYQKEGVYFLDQIKGKQNCSPVERYVPACVAFLNALDVHYNYHNDTLGMGVVFVQGKSQRVKEITDEDTQQFLVSYRSQFIYELPNPSKATFWIASLSQPMELENLSSQLTNPMKVVALLQKSILMLKVKLSWATTAKNILKGLQQYSIEGRKFKFLKLEVGRI